jgi:tripartite ATP-independent transporter DctM subunit
MAAMFTKLALPEMLRFKYHPRLAAGAIAAGGTFAAMIPPSGMMVIYCMFTEQSIGKLAIAGVIPGAVNTVLYICAIYLLVRFRPQMAPLADIHVSWRERLVAVRRLLPMALLIMFVLGSIYFGIATPTEAGAVGALGALMIAAARRGLPLKQLFDSLMGTAATTGMIFLIIIGAFIFSRFLAVSGLTTTITNWFTSLPVPPMAVMGFFMLVFLVLGSFLDILAMCALTLPLFFPVVESLGISGIWFGIVTIQMVEIAFVTPPLGMNVYVVKAAAGDIVSLGDIFSGAVFPFLIADMLFLALLFFFPQIALWLPGLMLGG